METSGRFCSLGSSIAWLTFKLLSYIIKQYSVRVPHNFFISLISFYFLLSEGKIFIFYLLELFSKIAGDKLKKKDALSGEICSQLLQEFIFSLVCKNEPYLTYINRITH